MIIYNFRYLIDTENTSIFITQLASNLVILAFRFGKPFLIIINILTHVSSKSPHVCMSTPVSACILLTLSMLASS